MQVAMYTFPRRRRDGLQLTGTALFFSAAIEHIHKMFVRNKNNNFNLISNGNLPGTVNVNSTNSRLQLK